MSNVGFYNKKFWGLTFGEKYRLGGKTHVSVGLDIIHPSRTPIPFLWSTGTVVSIIHSTILGQVVTVKNGKYYLSYLHVYAPVKIGTKLRQGDTVAFIASPEDFHGTAWTGPHTALHLGLTRESALGVGCINPAPTVLQYGK